MSNLLSLRSALNDTMSSYVFVRLYHYSRVYVDGPQPLLNHLTKYCTTQVDPNMQAQQQQQMNMNMTSTTIQSTSQNGTLKSNTSSSDLINNQSGSQTGRQSITKDNSKSSKPSHHPTMSIVPSLPSQSDLNQSSTSVRPQTAANQALSPSSPTNSTMIEEAFIWCRVDPSRSVGPISGLSASLRRTRQKFSTILDVIASQGYHLHSVSNCDAYELYVFESQPDELEQPTTKK